MVGYEGHRRWINYVGVLPELQRRGYAKWMMAETKRPLRLEGCAKINLQVRSSNSQAIAFYKNIGFSEDRSLAWANASNTMAEFFILRLASLLI